jgi:hypothetical protein
MEKLMASYDKSKLLQLLELRRAAFLQLRDANDRFSDARTERERYRNSILTDASDKRVPNDFLDRMLKLPTNDALALSADEVEIYSVQYDNEVRRYKTGIGLNLYRRFIAARDKAARLGELHDRAQTDIDERFGIVPRLVEAVREWGFTDPELEI